MLSDFHRELQHVEEKTFQIHTSYLLFQICENIVESRGNTKMKKGESAQNSLGGRNDMQAVFDDSLITGNKMIDTQHKELIDRINKLLILCENEKPAKREAVETLDYLADYTEFHFGEEEKLQEEIGYPGIAEHKKKHEELRQVVKDLYAMLEEQEGPTAAFVESVNENVTNWLYNHIRGFDRSVAEYRFMRDNESRI